MSGDDDLRDALGRLETPALDVDGALGDVRRRARRTRAVRLAGPVAAAVLVGAVTVALVAGRTTPGAKVHRQVLSAHVAREATTPSQAKAGVTRANAFSIDLFKQVASEQPGNLVLSPYSVDEALSMALAGARGATHDQIAKVLHAGADEADYHQALNALDRQLTAPRRSHRQGPAPEGPNSTLPPLPPVSIHVADSVWMQRGFAVEQAFLDRLARSYGAGVHTVDFEHQTEASRKAINAWVSEHTNGRIKDLLAKHDIDKLTRFVLVNAVTFSGLWVMPLEGPHPMKFTTDSGNEVTAQMLRYGGYTDGASGPGWRSAVLGYVGGAHLLVVLPDDLDAYVASLTPERFRSADATSEGHLWDSLSLPSFETTSRVTLDDSLKALGMPDAFDTTGRSDFSGIDGSRDLALKTVVQQAHIKVDRHGTEAEAATGVVGFAISGRQNFGPLVLDHPFLYAIVDDATGAILFMGRVDDPTAIS
jgi:serpin B